MNIPDFRNLSVVQGIVAEPTPGEGRLVLWLPAGGDGDSACWERVNNVYRAAVTVEGDLCWTEAASIRARRTDRGLFAKLIRRVRAASGEDELTLPTGEVVERSGDRRTDVLLAWPLPGSTPLGVTRIKSRWPQSQEVRVLANNLFMVTGVVPRRAVRVATNQAALADPPREQAERMVAAARKAGDRRAELSALTDLGLTLTEEGAARHAVPVLKEAQRLAGALGDRSSESEILGNLALAFLAENQPERALELFERGWAMARGAGNIVAEKVALERLGLAYSNMGEPERALDYFERALRLARRVGDRSQEATLLWHVAIQHAELGRSDRALTEAQAAVELFVDSGSLAASSYANHLEQFRLTVVGARPDAGALSTHLVNQSVSASSVGPLEHPASPQTASGPGLLAMAVSAAKSMARFLCTKMKTVPEEIHEARLHVCSSCVHHSGLRCRVCGCLTAAKAWLPHENCPIRKWPVYIAGPPPGGAGAADIT